MSSVTSKNALCYVRCTSTSTAQCKQANSIEARLSYDLPTSQKNASRNRATSEGAWQSFNVLIDFARELCSCVAQLGLIMQISRSDYGGPIFACLCLAQPLSDRLLRRSLYSSGHIVHANNKHYLRMQSLQELTDDGYRKDILVGNVSNYIKDEYAKAQRKLGTVSDIDADTQYTQRDTPEFDILSSLLYDLPMLFYAVAAIHNPSKLTIASIAILQQASMSLRQTFDRLLYDIHHFSSNLNRIKLIYDTVDIRNEVSDGELTYPLDNDKPPSGMSFDVRDVSFGYPASKSTRKALDKVSFSIKSGQLVVIVGANGSGKSTILNLLNRLYDPSSGNIFIDGQPINHYRVADLREATATLSQDHRIFPLAVSENIGLGNTSCIANLDMIGESAKRGGSFAFISKLTRSLSTNLSPPRTAYLATFRDHSHPLWSIFEKLEKPVELSGGEKQRLVASRTFMRLTSEKIRFVAVDEPSSALDSEGELELFQRLREARSGRTMLFVTHRFGHLTKHADLILCMKDGTVVESGTHNELIEQNGEYARFYKIQAQAFVTE